MLRDGAGDSPLSARTGGVASFECLAETKVRSFAKQTSTLREFWAMRSGNTERITGNALESPYR